MSSPSITRPMSSSTGTSRDTATNLGLRVAIYHSTNLGMKSAELQYAAWLGLAAVLVAVAGAWLVGYALGKPILRLARATSAIRTFDLSNARPLAGSHLRELDEAIQAYNALIATLHWFETYVPRRLVNQLMAQGEQATALVEREVTVLFTDIVEFTSLAERLSASEVAVFLNDHFRLLAACVEAEGGTIDKYVGTR